LKFDPLIRYTSESVNDFFEKGKNIWRVG
jgi:hypothetical protein